VAKKHPENQIVVVPLKNGLWFAKYDWGTSTAKDPYSAISKAIRARIKNAPSKKLQSEVPHFGEWYGGVQGTRNCVHEHQRELLEVE